MRLFKSLLSSLQQICHVATMAYATERMIAAKSGELQA